MRDGRDNLLLIPGSAIGTCSQNRKDLEVGSYLGQAEQNADHAAGSKHCPHGRLCKTSIPNCSLGFLLKFRVRREGDHFHSDSLHARAVPRFILSVKCL
jgi:hypothetical protein